MHVLNGAPFRDTARAFGLSKQLYGLAVAGSFVDARFSYSHHAGEHFDTVYGLKGASAGVTHNDGSRWFCDYLADAHAWPEDGSGVKPSDPQCSGVRCFSQGQAEAGHRMRVGVTVRVCATRAGARPATVPTVSAFLTAPSTAEGPHAVMGT